MYFIQQIKKIEEKKCNEMLLFFITFIRIINRKGNRLIDRCEIKIRRGKTRLPVVVYEIVKCMYFDQGQFFFKIIS